MKEESKIPLQKRTFFFYKEKLLQGEDQFNIFLFFFFIQVYNYFPQRTNLGDALFKEANGPKKK